MSVNREFNRGKLSKLSVTVITIIIAVTFTTHHLYGFIKYGSEYSPLKINYDSQYTLDETYLYAAQTHQYLNGIFKGDTYLSEHRDERSPFLGEAASIIPITILSILTGSVKNAFIASDLILPVLLFLIIYLIAKKLTGDSLISITAGLASIIIPNSSSLLPFFSKEGTTLTGSVRDTLLLTRTPHPQVSLIYLFVVLFFTYILLNKPTKRIAYFWSITIGISLYSSLFVATTVALGILILFPLIIKKIKIKLLLQCLVIILFIAVPYLINYLSSLNFIKDTDFLERTTYPIHILFPKQLRYLFFAVILTKFKKKDNLPKILLAFIFAASIISDAHQLILGINIDADHWINRVIAPLSTFSLVLIISNLLNPRKLSSRIITIGITILIVSLGIYRQISWVSENQSVIKPDTNIEKIVSEINEETSDGDVIGSSNSKISQNITGLTGRKSYLGPADRVLADYSERLQRACDLLIINGNPSQDVTEDMTEYAVGLLIWNEMSEERRNTVINFTTECVNSQSYSNLYKLDYIIEQDESSDEFILRGFK